MLTRVTTGFFYFFGIIGPLIGWFIGHWLHDFVGRLYARRHDGHIDPEARLIIAYPASVLLFASLLVLGFALERQWHYMVLAVFSAVQTVGVMIVTTAINAYLLDSYPEGSGEVGAWVTASRNWSGFMVRLFRKNMQTWRSELRTTLSPFYCNQRKRGSRSSVVPNLLREAKSELS